MLFSPSPAYHVMGAKAAKVALADTGVDYQRVQQAYVAYILWWLDRRRCITAGYLLIKKVCVMPPDGGD